MASHTISGQPWPDGTVVSVFQAAGYIGGAPPSGPTVTSATVATGSVTFTSLEQSVRYVAYAADHGITFLIPSSSGTGAGLPDGAAEGDVLAWDTGAAAWVAPGTSGATDVELAAHAADTTAVHGLSDTALAKGVALHNGTTYPSRPTGFGSVEWIGPTDPGGSAVNGDTWVPTA